MNRFLFVANLFFSSSAAVMSRLAFNLSKLNVSVNAHMLANGSVYAHIYFTELGFSPNPLNLKYEKTNINFDDCNADISFERLSCKQYITSRR